MKKDKKMQAKVDLKSNMARKKRVFFLRQVQQELKKVTWTTKEELKTCTKIVIISTFVLSLGIFAADVIIQGALQVVSSVAKVLGG